MITKEALTEILKRNHELQPKLDTLRLASEINPDFKNPHIVGGYLRNIILGAEPNDCDVVFQGYQLNQAGILEGVQEAEIRLGIAPYPDWEFENITATGYSGNMYEDIVGKYSYHTDYLTMLMMDPNGLLYVGEEQKTYADFFDRIYDLRFAGVALWANHRGKGRSYASCLTGDLIRGLYLSQSLTLTPSDIAAFLMTKFDMIIQGLEPADQEARKAFWMKKTKGDPIYQQILDRFGVTTLKTNSQS